MSTPVENDRYFLGPDWRRERALGSGSFGAVQLYTDLPTQKLYAVKLIERGDQIDQSVRKEVINHSMLQHNNIARFKEVILTDNGYLAIVMEYASGGDLFTYVQKARGQRLQERIARYFFQQLISGLGYMHTQSMCHRDMKLENTLLSGDPPKIKLCDFGYSKSSRWQSMAKSKVGTAAYIAPEVIINSRGSIYDGPACDVWSSGVMLHTMLSGVYPFCDREMPNDEVKTIKTIMAFWKNEVPYVPPESASPECKELLKRMLCAIPENRITVEQIIETEWFRTNLPQEFSLQGSGRRPEDGESQNASEVWRILSEASTQRIMASGSGQLTEIPEITGDDMDDEDLALSNPGSMQMSMSMDSNPATSMDALFITKAVESCVLPEQ